MDIHRRTIPEYKAIIARMLSQKALTIVDVTLFDSDDRAHAAIDRTARWKPKITEPRASSGRLAFSEVSRGESD